MVIKTKSEKWLVGTSRDVGENLLECLPSFALGSFLWGRVVEDNLRDFLCAWSSYLGQCVNLQDFLTTIDVSLAEYLAAMAVMQVKSS